MADMTITCASCGNQITVSEFVSAEFLTCMKCKASVSIPVNKPVAAESVRPRLNVKPAAELPPPAPPPPPKAKHGIFNRPQRIAQTGPAPCSLPNTLETVQASMPKLRRKIRQRRYSAFANIVMPWITFIVAAALLSWLRYWPGTLPEDRLELLIRGGVWSLLLLHVTIVVFAFGEDPFQGVLCALIPGYTLYYLFTQSDQYVLRSLVLALMLAFGLDTALAIRGTWRSFYKAANAWLEDTDYFNKDIPTK